MQFPSFTQREKINLLVISIFCILFGIRYYPGQWEKTLYESFRWIFAFFYFGGATTYIFYALAKKMFKRTFSLKQGIKIAFWLALFFSISQSLHEFLKLPPESPP